MRIGRSKPYIKRVKAGWEINGSVNDVMRMMVALKMAMEEKGIHADTLLKAMLKDCDVKEDKASHEQAVADRQPDP